MLSKITQEEFHDYLDFAYRLALEPERSGYPKSAEKGLCAGQNELLVYRREGVVEGWIQYFWEPETHYLQTTLFNIRTDMAGAMGEFLHYIKTRFPDYHIYMGFPEENRQALKCLSEHGFSCNEESYNNSFFFDTYHIVPEKQDIRAVDDANYQDFRTLHAPLDTEIYWNNDRILADIFHWNISIYYKNDVPAAALYFRCDSIMPEIYGIDYRNDIFEGLACRSLLIHALNEGKKSGAEYLVWFCDDQHQPLAHALGFHCVGKYLCFDKIV